MRRTFLAALTVLALVGCGNGIDTASTTEKPGVYVRFDSNTGTFAYPNNILFADSEDGTLNIPFEPTDADAALKAQLNSLDGFSTTSPITLPLSAEVNASTLPGNVHLFKVIAAASAQTYGIPAVGATEKELTYGVDFVTAVSGSKIAVLPLKPLAGHSNYMVVVTDGVRAANGGTLSPDSTTAMLNSSHALIDENNNSTVYFDPNTAVNNATAQQLELLRRLTQLMFAQAGANGIEAAHIVTAWSFQTQTIGTVQSKLAAAASAHTGSMLMLQDTNVTTQMVLGAGEGTAEIYAGVLANVPQYMPQPADANDTAAVTTGTFSYSAPFTPAVEANVSLPVVATVPDDDAQCEEPEAGWPVVIYQHGITRSRLDLFVFGETLAKKCFVGIAIDLPLHGVTDMSNPFYLGAMERTFNVDLVTENPYGTVVSPVPDGVIDSTGINFMNLAHLLTTRDNLRQTTSDLTVLAKAVGNAAGIKLNSARIAFLSHSLGNIASIGFLNQTDALQSAVLMMPGQQLIPLLLASPVFSPGIKTGLAGYGIQEGTPEYDAFLLASQTLIDDADPANYTPEIAAKTVLPILEMQAIGDGTQDSGDQYIPADIPGVPLSGGNPFIAFSSAEDINVSNLVDTPYGEMFFPDTSKTVTRITVGEHRSPLDPQYSVEAFYEYHSELISFIDSNGTAILVNSPSIIQ